MKSEDPGYRINNDRSAAVSTEYYFDDNMSTCPKGVKCLLLGAGGVATISEYHGDPFWISWFPMPRRKPTRPLTQTSNSGQRPQ